ncbi:hypothetical protein [Actinomycetospora straminea]|uniref:MYXO-CTERM domain-containing protein n=1 Tax=Actinomycetospora straminea TaxID=663607 RepID=A0ABP9E6V9_9PSEU|nr:hypothetical protein [Actinomycetospora straminea]MDD7936039.1 hypothetical protein [Actinomycetospora straminea]
MRLLLTSLVVALLALGAGTAAADPGLVIGDGAPLAPGTSLPAQMGCEEPATTPAAGPGVTGTAWERDPEGHQPWAVSSTVTIAADAAPGPVKVTATCGEQRLETTITVADTGAGTTWRVLGAAALLLVIVAVMVLLRRRRARA